VVKPAAILPEAIQTYLFLAARCVIGMHGGAWGSALVMSNGQAAVEILPTATNANAQHIVTIGGAKYERSLCVDCARSQTKSGMANLDDVVSKARKLLEAP
jgi:capsular polysaccharide biosynthesis protein